MRAVDTWTGKRLALYSANKVLNFGAYAVDDEGRQYGSTLTVLTCTLPNAGQ
jgi:regulation of enolase protein 1 (concanavalin A-like superfamily)